MSSEFLISSYDYHLPPEHIAQYPTEDRAASRLLVLDRQTDSISHRKFSEIIGLLREKDCLVINNSKVFPARITGRKPTGGKIEFFLLHYPQETGMNGHARALAMCRSSKPVRPGNAIRISRDLEIIPCEVKENGHVLIDIYYSGNLDNILNNTGRIPLPPYIKRDAIDSDRKRYQTIYASATGSVAAPTAGLHFTRDLLQKAGDAGIRVASVTLHVGYGTFAPIRSNDIREHRIHSEWVEISQETARTIQATMAEGGRVVAVGTTSVRSLEFTWQKNGRIEAFAGECDLYIVPGHRFNVVGAMITNFHLPRSSLLVLVSAFAGRKRILSAYKEAISKGYRFYSYGDAMLIT